MSKYYVKNGNYMLREPFFPIQLYQHFFENQNNADTIGEELLSNKIFKEQLLVSTKGLYKSIYEDNLPINNSIIKAITKYAIRSCMRTTPYGLFAGIDCGEISDTGETNISDQRKYIRATRVDMGWLCKLIDRIEHDQLYQDKLNVIFNPHCYIKGNYVINCCTHLKEHLSVSTGSIRYTPLVELIMKHAENKISISILKEHIREKYPKASENKIANVLVDLLDKDYLFSDVRVPLNNKDCFSFLIDKVYAIDIELYDKLIEIADLIHSYDQTAIGDGTNLFLEIIRKMSLIVESSDYLHVDLVCKHEKNMLSERVANEIAELVNAFQPLCSYVSLRPYINSYKNRFVERYGTNVEVPILEVIDPNIGIGIPNENSFTDNANSSLNHLKDKVYKKFLNFIQDKVIRALYLNQNEVYITTDDIERFIHDNKVLDEWEEPDSLSVFVELLENGCNNHTDFRLQLSGVRVSPYANNVWGRFGHLFNEKMFDIPTIHAKNAESEYIEVELSEMPSDRRYANVCVNYTNLKYGTSLDTNLSDSLKQISLNDIYLGLESIYDNFYFKSKTLNKKIDFRTTHMLNLRVGSQIFRLLREISMGENNRLNQILFDIRNMALPYSPRIIFNKITIKDASWVLNISDFNPKDNLLVQFNKYREKMSIPKVVYVEEYDEQLCLNLDINQHVTILLDILKKWKTIILFEAYDYIAVRNNHNSRLLYKKELVIPLWKEKALKVKSKKQNESLPIITNRAIDKRVDSSEECILFPGEENWLYFKIYGLGANVNKFISNYLVSIVLDQSIKDLYDEYYYIRYYDIDSHIRFRIRAKNSEVVPILQEKIMQFLKKMRMSKILHKIEIDSYMKESTRYGGAISLAEQFFYRDSILCMKLLSISDNDSIIEKKMVIEGIISIMRSFGLTEQNMLSWLSEYIKPQDFRKEYKAIRKHLFNEETFDFTYIDSTVNQLYKSREKQGALYKQALDTLDSIGLLTNTKENILSSLIHMFCNRYNGNNVWENEMRALTRHYLYEKIQKQKHYPNP